MNTDPPAIVALALFCDDIRTEVTGKTILIGQSLGSLVLPPGAPPLDRLSVLLTLRWPRGYMPQSLVARIEIPGSPPALQQLPVPPPPDSTSRPASAFSGAIMQAAFQLRFLPLRVGDVIDVWVQADGHDIPAGRLRVTDPISAAADSGTATAESAAFIH